MSPPSEKAVQGETAEMVELARTAFFFSFGCCFFCWVGGFLRRCTVLQPWSIVVSHANKQTPLLLAWSIPVSFLSPTLPRNP